MDKSFVTCFDKEYEESAELLETLVSENSFICNISRKREIFEKDRVVTSNEYVLKIGPRGTKIIRESFPDQYNKYGIHIGYRGHKAWISCENFDWNEQNLKEFHIDLMKILKHLGMRIDIGNDIDENILEKIENPNNISSMLALRDDELIKDYLIMINVIMKSIKDTKVSQNGFIKILKSFKKWINDLLKSSDRRKQQYKLAVVIFYHEYITKFLEITSVAENMNEEASSCDL